MERKIQLVAIDLDGTLLNRQKKITPRNLRALEAVRQKGILIVPVTGRPWAGIPPEVMALPGIRYTVTSNGATIRDHVEKKVLLEHHLDMDLSLDILARTAHFDMVREVCRDGIGYMEQGDFDILRARYEGTAMLDYLLATRRVVPGTLPDFIREAGVPVEELYFLTNSRESKVELRSFLTGTPGIGFANPFPNDLEVMSDGIDKGVGLRWLTDYLNIPLSETMAIGDEGSDLPMLEEAGLSVAMANGASFVRKAADFVTASCDEDGVAIALEKYLL